jgi:hypothetical protein
VIPHNDRHEWFTASWLPDASRIRKCSPGEIRERHAYLCAHSHIQPPSPSEWYYAEITSLESLGALRTVFRYDWYFGGRVFLPVREVIPQLMEHDPQNGQDCPESGLFIGPRSIPHLRQRLRSGEGKVTVTLLYQMDGQAFLIDGNRSTIAFYENAKEIGTDLRTDPFSLIVLKSSNRLTSQTQR